ncbi:DUF5655 domain-containing protein [Kribbella sp. NBC_01245]|uniref:DUF5655 domain-containing protein n=1 Tax=Kribbella sp. NBC_01245 TaxID=2903578 RepID=UPI002E2C1BF9|nr:DUF5655 domain-containing protein [Kribbella sp. NBC_01245]
MWVCVRCGRDFANRNQTHTCAPLHELDDHFAGKAVVVRETFDRVVEEVRRLGPVDVLSEKTRIALHHGMSFAAFVPRKNWLDGHVVLAERLESPRFRRIDVYSVGNVVHVFRLADPVEVDAEFVAWLVTAYRKAARHVTG